MQEIPANTPKFSFNLSWLMIALLIFIMPFPNLYAQDEDYEDPTEVFWGDDEDEEFYDGDDVFYEDEEFYDEDEEFYDEDDVFYEDDTSEYYEDDEFYEDDEYYEDEEDLSETELADTATRMGYSMSISGASPGFVNNPLNTYNNNPQANFLSVEFPLLMQLMGVRFRFGAEIGKFGFENYLPVSGKYSGITAMGLLAFPAGPGKVKLGAGLIGNTFGISAEMTYGFSLGNTLELRAGVRSTTAWNVTDDKSNELGTISWLDGLIMLGFNL